MPGMPAVAVKALPSEAPPCMQSRDSDRNYFELFGLNPVFDIDTAALQAAQQRVQASCHPDRHVGGSAAERRAAVQMASLVNQAYATLRDPVKRARYLLQLNGARLPDDSETTADTAFLMEQMELREAVEACRAADDPLGCCARVAARLAERADELARAFVADLDAGELDAALDSSRKMQFVQRIRQQLDELQFELEDG